MTKRGSRSLSRESREARLAAARQQLNAFLEMLDPLIKRTLFERDTLTLEEWGRIWSDRLPDCSAARQEYERLAIEIPDEWRRYARKVGPYVTKLAELRLVGRARKPGAPRRTLESTEHVLISKLIGDATASLSKGWTLCRARKEAGGSDSDDESIRPALRDLGYGLPEQSAILNKNTLQGAAVLLVARQTDKNPRTIWSSIRRARLNAPSK